MEIGTEVTEVTKKYRAVGTYIFAGGFAVGVRDAGFNIVAHLEKGNYGVETFRKNFPMVPVWQNPVNWPLTRLASEGVDFIYCNPPCAAWSMAGKSLTGGKTSWLTDGRVSCVLDVFKVLRAVQPTILVWESVTQAFLRARVLIRDLTILANNLGYAVTYLFTSSGMHGVPQPRHRFMMFCHKVALDLPKPTDPPKNIAELLGLHKIQLPDGTWDWAQDCPVWGIPEMSDRYYRLATATAPGEGIRDTWADLNSDEDGRTDPPHWDAQSPAFMAHRLQMDGCGQTFTSAVMEIHPVWNRWVANSEVGRLSGWPDDYKWCGETQEVRAQMVQAVLPPVGKYVGNCVRRALDANVPVTPQTFLVNHLDGRIFL